jgi:hypothetical protein
MIVSSLSGSCIKIAGWNKIRSVPLTRSGADQDNLFGRSPLCFPYRANPVLNVGPLNDR